MDPFALIPAVPLALFLAVFGTVAAVWVHEWRAKNRRREAVARWAMSQGLTFAPADVSLLRHDFSLFSRGDGRGCENVATGRWHGHDVHVADYWYYERSGSGRNRSRTYHRFSVAVVRLGAVVPSVRIERENPVTWLADRVGFRDITFESEEFNRRFDVHGDREFAFKLLDARMIDWLLGVDGRQCYEVKGSSLLAYSSPTEPAEVLSAATAFLDRVPRLVWADYGTGEA